MLEERKDWHKIFANIFLINNLDAVRVCACMCVHMRARVHAGMHICIKKSWVKIWMSTSPKKIYGCQMNTSGFSTSLVIKEIQMKTIATYHYTPIRMWQIFLNDPIKCWWGHEGTGTFIHCCGEYSLVQLLLKTVWLFHFQEWTLTL